MSVNSEAAQSRGSAYSPSGEGARRAKSSYNPQRIYLLYINIVSIARGIRVYFDPRRNTMALDVFITFDGDCRKALECYAKIFKLEMPKQIMTYGQNPEGSSARDKDRILYACMPMFGRNVMFSDCPSGGEFIKGNNIMLTIGLSSPEEIRRIFRELSEGGEVYMPLEKTFFSELFGMVCDKFGIIWQLSKG
jgi:PhnB protein